MTTSLGEKSLRRKVTIEVNGEPRDFVIGLTPMGITVKESRKRASKSLYVYPLEQLAKDAIFAKEGRVITDRLEQRKRHYAKRKAATKAEAVGDASGDNA
jgi:hypothetical protein